MVGRIRAAFPAYLTTRERIVRAGGPSAVDSEANRDRLRAAFDRLQHALEAFGAAHFASAGGDPHTPRAGGAGGGQLDVRLGPPLARRAPLPAPQLEPDGRGSARPRRAAQGRSRR